MLDEGRDTLWGQKTVNSFHRYHKVQILGQALRGKGEKGSLLHICSQQWLELFVV